MVDMKKIAAIVLLLLPGLWSNAQQRHTYPVAPKSIVVDTIWGQPVSDPYRTMEEIASPEVAKWIGDQEKLTRKQGRRLAEKEFTIDKLSQVSYKPIIRQEGLNFFYGYAKQGETPSLYLFNQQTQQQELLFNPNNLSQEKRIAIAEFVVSPNRQLLALTLSTNGSDWREVRFMDMQSRTLLPDRLQLVRFSTIAWYGNGIFYARYGADSTNTIQKESVSNRALYYHLMGTNQQNDVLVFAPEKANSFFSFDITPNRKSLVLYHIVEKDGRKENAISSADLSDTVVGIFRTFLSIPDSRYQSEVVGSLNDSLIVFTNLLAPNGQVILFSRNTVNDGRQLIPEQGSMLTRVKLLNNMLVCQYSNRQQEHVAIYSLTGQKLNQWNIPSGFSITDLTGSATDSLAAYSFHSFYTPPTVYTINLNTFERKPFGKTLVQYNHKQFSTLLLTYKSKDSTEIPIMVTYKKGTILNGTNPLLLYGYGGFGIPTKPFYDPTLMAFLLDGGVVAVPAIRGGGDFPGWHEAGRRLNKQKSIDDFIAAAEYLIRNGFTNSSRLAILGGSNGGLIVGAAITQRPELFKAAVAESGLFDMLRYQKQNTGYSYTPEYGSVNDSTDFINLKSYSPVHNVKPGVRYPSTLLVASENDDRVSPFHTFKFLAELQEKSTSDNSYLLYYQRKAGHIGTEVYSAEVKKRAFVVSWIEREVGMGQ